MVIFIAGAALAGRTELVGDSTCFFSLLGSVEPQTQALLPQVRVAF